MHLGMYHCARYHVRCVLQLPQPTHTEAHAQAGEWLETFQHMWPSFLPPLLVVNAFFVPRLSQIQKQARKAGPVAQRRFKASLHD